MKPYGVISDTHNHGWSAFSTTLTNGVNSRLQMILDETKRCAEEVRKAGGFRLFHAGDLFHVRGSIAPSVLNPTMDTYRDLIKAGFEIVLLSGNHDLEGKEADRITSAITALEGIGCKVISSNFGGYNASDDVAMIPWTPNIQELKKKIEAIDPSDRPGCDLILHAPIDDVIPGLPPHGLTADYLSRLGFRRVISGHYHHHKDFGNGVYSIGALTHQTWSDLGSKAGFLVVSDSGVKWFASHAPSFVEISAATDPSEVPLIVDGNYARIKINSTKTSDVEATRQFLLDNGALGVIVLAQKELSAPVRSGATVKAGASIESSITDFIKGGSFARSEDLAHMCQDILTTVRSAA